MRFQTAFVGTYSGFKQPYDFTGQDGSQVSVQGKLQFLTRDERGQAEVMDITVSQWERASGPALNDLADGQDFKLAGEVVIGERSYFALRTVEQL